MAWILCSGLHAWLSAQSLLVAVLHSLIARRRFGPRARWRPLRETLASGLGLGGLSLAWSAVVQLLAFIYSGVQWNWPWVLVFVYHCDWFDFYVFALVRWLGWGLCASRTFEYFCIGSSIGTQGGVGLLWGCFRPPPVVYSAGRSGAVVPVLVLLFVALWFILRGDLFYVLPCVVFFVCFGPFGVAITSLGEVGSVGGCGGGGVGGARRLVLVLFVRLFDLRLFGFVCFLFLLVSGKSCGLWLWHSLDFSLIYFLNICSVRVEM